MPAFHKTIKNNYDASDEVIYEIILKGKGLEWDNPHISPANMIPESCKVFFMKNKEETLKIIAEVKKIYKKIWLLLI